MAVVQDVKNRTEIIDVISDYVALQKTGRNFQALCPFHNETAPSFIVSQERQTWRCFGACATGGDVISFIMKAENQDFGQALVLLAKKAGIDLPSRQTNDVNEKLFQINLEAADFYSQHLESLNGAVAREYIKHRGIDEPTIRMFRLGLSPTGTDVLTRHLLGSGYTTDDVLLAGLGTRHENGSVRDFFRRRLMFPIQDASGRVVGFGGRSLDDSTPKYLNTPRTPIFDKSRLLYGLSLAKNTIVNEGTAVIVEGYMDVITAHQFGYQQVIASMGTALTGQQVGTLKPLASTFVLAMDADNAGKEATLRSLESSWKAMEIEFIRTTNRGGTIFNQQQMKGSLKVASLPPDTDPDSLIRNNKDEWGILISESKPLLEYLFHALPSRFETETDDGKLQLLDALSPFIRSETNPFALKRHLENLANIVSYDEKDLQKYIWDAKRRAVHTDRKPNKIPEDSAQVPTARRDHLEEYCLYLLLEYPELRNNVSTLPPDRFELSENRDIFTNWTLYSTIEGLIENLSLDLIEHLREIQASDNPPLNVKDRQPAILAVTNRIKERFFKAQEQALLERLDGIDWLDIDSLKNSLEATEEINQELRQLFSARKQYKR